MKPCLDWGADGFQKERGLQMCSVVGRLWCCWAAWNCGEKMCTSFLGTWEMMQSPGSIVTLLLPFCLPSSC